jgi:S-formylglutathione hydrolase FrmB
MRIFPQPSALIPALVAAALASATGVAQSQTARTVRFETATGQATVAVLLPADYDSTTFRYPVLYLLHGGTQNHTAFPARSWFTRDASRRGMIVVMPHLQPFLFSARGDEPAPVEDFLGRELPAYIDSHYRTVNDRRARAIAGISMGGYGATLLGVKRPDVFGTVGAISAALSTGNRPRDVGTHVAALTPDRAPYFYIACGVADPVLTASRDLSTQLVARQIRSELKEVPGGHGWEVWDPQVRAFFDVLAKLPGWAPIKDDIQRH